MAKPLTEIINQVVPLGWKVARVVPLFKKGKVENMDNYRPISIMRELQEIERWLQLNGLFINVT